MNYVSAMTKKIKNEFKVSYAEGVEIVGFWLMLAFAEVAQDQGAIAEIEGNQASLNTVEGFDKIEEFLTSFYQGRTVTGNRNNNTFKISNPSSSPADTPQPHQS